MKIVIGIPTRGQIHYTLLWALLGFSKRHDLGFIVNRSCEGAGANRNTIVKKFLETSGDFLLMIDDDTTPPYDLNLDLLTELDKDILVLPYPLNMNTQTEDDLFWSIFPEPEKMTKKKGKGLEEIYAAGTGFVLIKRKVLEALDPPFKYLRDKYDNIDKAEDYLFCERAREKGFKTWVDWDYPCSHWKDTNLLNII